MPGATVTYERAELLRYIDKLTGAPDRIARRGAEPIVEQAKQRAPVRTGFLRNSIHTEHQGKGQWQAVADAPYALFVEVGTVFMSAQPYMIPAAESVRVEFADIARVELTP